MKFHSKSELYQKYDKTVRAAVNRLLLTRRLACLPIDREDLYQIGWIALLKCVPHFDTSRGVKFETYASTVIVNAVNKEIKHYVNRKMPNFDIDIEDETEDSQSEMLSRLIAVTKEMLSKREFAVFWMKFIDNKTFTEIGENYGFSRETARKIYNNSLDKIKESIV